MTTAFLKALIWCQIKIFDHMRSEQDMDYIWHIVKFVNIRSIFLPSSVIFTAPLQKIIIILIHNTYRGLIGLFINTNDSTITLPSWFQTSISDPYSVLKQKRLTTAAIFKSSVVGNSAISDWLQKTFCSEANKASHGPNSSSKDCSLHFPGFRLPVLSGKETD